MQVISTGSYNFSRMAIFTCSHMQHEISPLGSCGKAVISAAAVAPHSEAISSAQEAATIEPTERQKQFDTGLAPNAELQPQSTSVIAIAGLDPAVLQIWDLQVFSCFEALHIEPHAICRASLAMYVSVVHDMWHQSAIDVVACQTC